MSKLSSAGIKATSKQAPLGVRMRSSGPNGQDRSGGDPSGDPNKELTERVPQSLLHNNNAREDIAQDLTLDF